MRVSIAFAFAASGLAAAPAAAQELAVSVEIPRLRVAEYHRPYVAIWIEDEAGKAVRTLNVWYDGDLSPEGSRPLANLPAGNYKLRVEAAREVGGRELVTLPFQWPPRAATSASAEGKSELGTVRLTTRR